MITINSARLTCTQITERDWDFFHALQTDPQVMYYVADMPSDEEIHTAFTSRLPLWSPQQELQAGGVPCVPLPTSRAQPSAPACHHRHVCAKHGEMFCFAYLLALNVGGRILVFEPCVPTLPSGSVSQCVHTRGAGRVLTASLYHRGQLDTHLLAPTSQPSCCRQLQQMFPSACPAGCRAVPGTPQ